MAISQYRVGSQEDYRRNRDCLPEIATSAVGLLAMTSRGLLPFYRQPVRVGSIAPGPAVPSPTMAGVVGSIAPGEACLAPTIGLL